MRTFSICSSVQTSIAAGAVSGAVAPGSVSVSSVAVAGSSHVGRPTTGSARRTQIQTYAEAPGSTVTVVPARPKPSTRSSS